MTTATDLIDRLLPSTDRAFDVPALTWLDDHGFPTDRDEAWKYTPLREILSRPFHPAATPPLHRLTSRDIDDLAGVHGATRLVFVNGSFDAGLSTVANHSGVVCTNASSGSASEHRISSIFGKLGEVDRFDGFQALNHAASHDAALVLVEPGTRVVEPIHLVHVSVPGDEPVASHPRTLIHAGRGATLTVIETYTGPPASGLTNATTTLRADDEANVSHYKIQTHSSGSIHLGHLRIRQAAGSTVRSCSVTLGADIARTAIDAVLDGAGARSHVIGLYLPTGTQHHDHVVTVEHAASDCTSTQLFKGAIGDHARGSFSGHVIVRPRTTGTDARQTSRSLLLAATAQADARPWLEILSDDVQCTHGATVGRLDDEALFYLRTRGIPEHDARLMLIDAFVNEIGDMISLDTLRAHVRSAIVAKRAAATPPASDSALP